MHCTVLLEADWQVVAVQLPVFLWLVMPQWVEPQRHMVVIVCVQEQI